jgi:hypothetical protein
MVSIEGLEKVACNSCGSIKNLVYHHISYEPEQIEVLCRKCHGVEHSQLKGKVRPENFVSKIVVMNCVKLETDVKVELEKIAGEIQAKQAGSVTLSDAVIFLIKFYREHQEA